MISWSDVLALTGFNYSAVTVKGFGKVKVKVGVLKAGDQLQLIILIYIYEKNFYCSVYCRGPFQYLYYGSNKVSTDLGIH